MIEIISKTIDIYRNPWYNDYRVKEEKTAAQIIEASEERMVNMKEMGMTDKQFNGFIRFLVDDLKDIQVETDEKKKEEKIKKILDNLQKTLED